MANNWKFFQQTELSGGTTNPTENVVYVDSHNGSDVTGTGSHDNPKETIQGAIDAKTIMATNVDVVIAGTFRGVGVAGDFIGGTGGAIIAEGNVVFDGDGVAVAPGFYTYNESYRTSVKRYKNGRITFKNYSPNISPTQNYRGFYDVTFINCISVLASAANIYTRFISGCIFINCIAIGDNASHFPSSLDGIGKFYKNTIINSRINFGNNASGVISSNFFDENSFVYFYNNNPPKWDFNLLEGSYASRIYMGGAYHNDIEAYKIANPTKAINDLPSATNPLFNQVNDLDYTLQEGSPLTNAGDDGRQIGCFQAAKAVGASFSGWTGTTNIDNTTTPGEAVLNGSPVGTMESEGIELFPKARKVTRINMPDFEFNSPLGEMIGNLAADNTPYLLDVEVQYSLDNITYNGTWLRMAVGTQPLHDTTNDVGTDDPLYDVTTAEIIVCKYMKFRITLRDNEIQI